MAYQLRTTRNRSLGRTAAIARVARGRRLRGLAEDGDGTASSDALAQLLAQIRSTPVQTSDSPISTNPIPLPDINLLNLAPYFAGSNSSSIGTWLGAPAFNLGGILVSRGAAIGIAGLLGTVALAKSKQGKR